LLASSLEKWSIFNMRQIILLLGILSSAQAALDVNEINRQNKAFIEELKASAPKTNLNLKGPDNWLGTMNDLDIDLANYSCLYDRRDNFVAAFWEPFVLEGLYEPKTGRIIQESLKHTFEGSASNSYYVRVETYCTRQPEWGEDYVDEKCRNKILKQVETAAEKAKKELVKKSVYRQCGEIAEP